MKYLFVIIMAIASGFVMAQKQESLFNGKDLSGWRIHGTEKWFVDQGELICESGPDKQYGYLSSEREFKDFDLRLEFRAESNGNSGVFFHSQVEGTRVSGWQAEVAPPGLHSGGIYESYGRGWLIKPDAAKEKFLKAEGWNKMRVQVRGNTVVTWINGQQMISLTDEKIGSVSGRISLQIHDGGGVKVRWRNIRIRQL